METMWLSVFSRRISCQERVGVGLRVWGLGFRVEVLAGNQGAIVEGCIVIVQTRTAF